MSSFIVSPESEPLFTRLAAGLRRAIAWPSRVIAARKAMGQLAGMSDYELHDIGLTRQDIADLSALPLDADPTLPLVRRRSGRANLRPSNFGRAA
jgi:uncharacterized protein YjiS (DUF1127 family)